MTTCKKQRIRSAAWLLALALLMMLVPNVSAAEDTAATAKLVFSDSGIRAAEGSDTGYQINGTALTINAAGTYMVSGSCSNGSIKVKKGTTGVTLVLNGLNLTSTETAPITCNKSTEVNIVVSSGTTNTVTDSADNNDENAPDNDDAENAVIKCKDGSQVTISGSGTLNVNANGKNGIKSGATTEEDGTAVLTIRDVTLNINAPVNDAINAEQTLNIPSGTLTISAADDAIHSDVVLNIGADGTAGPAIHIKNCYEGLEAATLNICSGNLSITASDDCLNAANSDLTNYSFSMNISGGTINACTSGGDGFDSNGTLTISGGTINVWSANTADNQPLDADGTISITGGTVLAAGGSSGMGMNLSATQAYVTFGGMGGQPGGLGGRAPGNSDSTASSVSISKGSTLSIQSDSSAVFSTTALCNANYVFFSSASLNSGTDYTLSSGGSTATATAQTGTSQSGTGGMQPGGSPDRQPGNGQEQPGQRPGPAPGQSGSRFSDVSSDSWYSAAVQYVCDAGLMFGTGNRTFSPDTAATRGMIVTILYRLEGSPAAGDPSFQDVASGDYDAAAVAWAAQNGIVNGYSSTRFGPEDAITREQLAAILYRYANYKGYNTSSQTSLAGYTDGSSVADYARAPVAWAVQSGIINGVGSSRLSPASGATRAQAAAVLMRLCQKYTAA